MSKTDKISVYYDKEKDGDLKAMIKKLSEGEGNFFRRSESEIIRLILSRALPKELEKLGIKKSWDLKLVPGQRGIKVWNHSKILKNLLATIEYSVQLLQSSKWDGHLKLRSMWYQQEMLRYCVQTGESEYEDYPFGGQ